MVIERQIKDGKTVFTVCGDVRETGDKRPHDIVTLDTLAKAALVMKYMRGDRMPPSDAVEAKEAIYREP